MEITIKGFPEEISEWLKTLKIVTNDIINDEENSALNTLKSSISKHEPPKRIYVDNGTFYAKKRNRRPMANMPDFFDLND